MRLDGDKRRAMRPATGSYAALSLLCLALYLPGLSRIPVLDRDEARFAEATREMIESGDLVRPQFHFRGRYKKPIGIYWLQAAAVIATATPPRAGIWAYRLPSVAGALAAVLMTCWIGGRLFGGAVGLLGAALLASSTLLVAESTIASADAVLLACVVLAQGCLAMIYLWPAARRPAPARYAAGFWAALGLGILVKGPIIPAVAGLTVISLAVLDSRRMRGAGPERSGGRLTGELRWRWGVPLAAAIVMPWALAVGWATNGEFYRQAFSGDIWPKLIGGQEGHLAPPGYYTIAAIGTFWPGSLVAGYGVLRAVRRRCRPRERVLLAWLIPSWIVFELMPTKLPHYTLPAYPALALLAARAVSVHWPVAAGSRLLRAEAWTWGAVTLLGGLAIVAAPVVLGGGFMWPSLIPAAAAIGAAIAAGGWCLKGRTAQAAWLGVIAAVAVLGPLRQWVIPDLDALWLSRAVAAAVAARPQAHDGGSAAVAAVGYGEPSLIFLLGPRTRIVDPGGAAGFLSANPQGLVVASGEWAEAFKTAARRDGLRVRELWSTRGIDYSKGRRISLELFAREGDAR